MSFVYTQEERQHIVSLVTFYIDVLGNMNEEAWERLSIEYCSNASMRPKTAKQLKRLWRSEKAKRKKKDSQDHREVYRTEDTTPAASIPRVMSSVCDSCVGAVPADAASRQDVTCSRKTQVAVATHAIGTQFAMFLVSASSQTEVECPEDTTPAASIPRVMSSTCDGCVAAVPAAAASRQDVTCSQKTQATITTRAIGTQCALTFLISASSQTDEEFSDRDVDESQAGASEKIPPSGEAADVAAEAGPHTCFCCPCFGNKGENIHFRGKLCSCLTCEQHNHRTNPGEVFATMMAYSCTICKKAFLKKRSLVQHMKVHPGQNHQMCGTLNKHFTYGPVLATHGRVHSYKGRCVCSICQKSDLVVHERLRSGQKPYVCGICRKSFTLKGNLVNHERLHSGERPYACSICQKSFARRGELARHGRLHPEGSCACSVCHKSFIRSNDLVRHERLHCGERPLPYVCGVCQKTFSHKSKLVVHERVHSGERPYVCKTCDKGFAQKNTLVKHEKNVHSDERPYVCKTCKDSFARKYALVRHEKRLHPGERPYLCSICEKNFSEKCALNKHKRLHSGEKPYICRFCPNTFAQKAQLDIHERQHSGKRKDSSLAL